MNAPVLQTAAPQQVPATSLQPVVYVSHSSKSMYEACPQAWQYRYEKRLESDVQSHSLAIGRVYDQATMAFLEADALGKSLDPGVMFHDEFEKYASVTPIAYNSIIKDQTMALAMGQKLAERFAENWVKNGYKVLLDLEGKPIIQRKLQVKLDGNVIYTSILDLMMMLPDSRVVIADVKSAASPAGETFSELAGQLSGQQLVVQAHMAELGIDSVDGVCFYEGIKKAIPKTAKGTGPEVLTPTIMPVRTKAEIDEYIQSVLWFADDIRRKRFPRRPGMAFNSPCNLCDFALLCTTGLMAGLHERPKRK